MCREYTEDYGFGNEDVEWVYPLYEPVNATSAGNITGGCIRSGRIEDHYKIFQSNSNLP